MARKANPRFVRRRSARITDTYRNWRGDGTGTYEDVQGFCKRAKLEEVRTHGHVLTPGRYVGSEIKANLQRLGF